MLRSFRLQLGISQEELAHRADVSRNYVSLLEQGRRTPALGVVFALADALSQSASELVAAVESRDRESRYLPLYTVEAAAGRFLDNRPAEVAGWLPAPAGLKAGADLFVVRIVGHSMTPLLPDGSFAVFRAGAAGDRTGRILLIQLLSTEDPDSGGAFTVKRWHSDKEPAPAEEGGWRHRRIQLRPVNPQFSSLDLHADDEVRVVGEFVRIL